MRFENVSLPDHPQLADAAAALARSAADHDGIAPLSEQFERGLADARLDHTHRIARDGDTLVAVAATAPSGDTELVVSPAHRSRGVGGRLAESLADHPLWAHGNLPPARRVAARLGLAVRRELLVLAKEQGEAPGRRIPQVNLPEVAAQEGQLPEAKQSKVESPEAGVPALELPEGFRFDTLAAYSAGGTAGAERSAVEQEWLRVNNEAFSWHPEQGGWDLARLRQAQEADWFDPAGVILLWRGERLAGFHWTKRHPDGTGEVYVIGVANDARGRGLGRPLLEAGLQHLGKGRVILYVEADNKAAVRLYEKSGFTVAESHVVYAKAGD